MAREQPGGGNEHLIIEPLFILNIQIFDIIIKFPIELWKYRNRTDKISANITIRFVEVI